MELVISQIINGISGSAELFLVAIGLVITFGMLDDVNMACNLHIDTGDFLSFADYFFDGFVVDWMVQDRINNAKRQVEEAIRRTESIVNQLQRM